MVQKKNLQLLSPSGPPRLVGEAGTNKFARDFAKEISKKMPGKTATVVALSGELGAGKTTFTKAFLKELGVSEEVTSPTFILFRPYPLKNQPYVLAYHIDCYRLEDPAELLKLGLREMLANPRHLVIIEWAERVRKYLPKKTIWLKLRHGAKKTVREIVVSGRL